MKDPATYKRTVWSSAFLGATGAAVFMELVAAYKGDEDLKPWTHFVVTYVPKPVTLGVAGILSTWLPWHFARAYKRAGK